MAQKAYMALGVAHFKKGVMAGDFNAGSLLGALVATSSSTHGTDNISMALCRFRDWPTEPKTAPDDLHELKRLHIETSGSQISDTDRVADLHRWKAEGQTWITAFNKPA